MISAHHTDGNLSHSLCDKFPVGQKGLSHCADNEIMLSAKDPGSLREFAAQHEQRRYSLNVTR